MSATKQTARVEELLASISQVETSISRVIAQLRDLSPEGSSHLEQQRLGGEGRELLHRLTRLLGEGTDAARDVPRPTEKQAMVARVEEREGYSHRLRMELRKALLDAKQRSEAFTVNTGRETLFAQRHDPLRQRNVTVDAEKRTVLNAASDVTSALQRTTALMSQEVEKSILNTAALDESTRLLRRTRDEYHGLGGVLRASRQALAQLERGDLTDRLLLIFGLVVFSSVVLYVLGKRVWIPGLGWLLRRLWGMLWGSSSMTVAHA